MLEKRTQLTCSDLCKFPGKPCGFNESVGYTPCVDQIIELKKRISKICGIEYAGVKSRFPLDISSQPDAFYVTNISVIKNKREIPVGRIENGVFTSE